MRARLPIVLAGLLAGCTPPSFRPALVEALPPPPPARAPVRPPETPPPPPSVAPIPPPRLGPFESATLANGLGLVIGKHDEERLVELRLVIAGAGGLADRPGVAELVAELVARGAATRGRALALSQALGAAGAELGWEVHAGSVELALSAPAELLPEALAALAVALGPRLGGAHFDATRRRAVARALAHGRGHDRWIARELVTRVLVGGAATSRRAVHGTASELGRVTAAHCEAFFRQRYLPAAATLYLIGDVDAATARQVADKALAAWRRTGKPAAATAQTPGALSILAHDAAPTTVTAGWALPPGALVRRALAALFERALPGAEVRLVGLAGGAVLTVRRETSDVAATVAELRQRPALPEVRPIQQALAAILYRDLDTASGVAERLSWAARHGDDHARVAGYGEQAAGLTSGALAPALAAATVRVIVIGGDLRALEPALSKLGRVQVVNPLRGFDVVRTIGAR